MTIISTYLRISKLQPSWPWKLSCQTKECTHTTFTYTFSLCVCSFVCVCAFKCTCVCVCVWHVSRYCFLSLSPQLLLVWQRQVANFLPFDLQQFPHSKETVQTHACTHISTDTHIQRRSLGCPGWTGAEVLQKALEGSERSFDSGPRVILAPNLTGLNDHHHGDKTSVNMHIRETERCENLWL